MALVTSKKMFEMAYKNGYAIGAFNVNNMEIVQGITEACKEEKAPSQSPQTLRKNGGRCSRTDSSFSSTF